MQGVPRRLLIERRGLAGKAGMSRLCPEVSGAGSTQEKIVLIINGLRVRSLSLWSGLY